MNSRAVRFIVSAAVAAGVLAGCGSTSRPPTSADPSDGLTVPPTVSGTPTAPSSSPENEAIAVFEEWLRASRKPDTTRACELLTEALQARMVKEAALPGVTTCAQLIKATAELFGALGQGPEHTVEVESAVPTEVVLEVTYRGSDCGNIVLEKRGTWIITEQTQETC